MNARLYSLLLRLYPAELRDGFGAEMTQVFLDDLDDNRRRHGFPGIARVWWCSLRELFRVALPAASEKPEIVISALMYFLQSLYLGGALTESLTGKVFTRLLCSGLVPAVTTFIALKVGSSGIPDPSILGRR